MKTLVTLAQRHSAMLAGLAAQTLQYGSALLMLPILVNRLTEAEVGLWYLFVAMQGLSLIADLGFQATFARNFGLAHAGVQELRATGVANTSGEQPNWQLFGAILRLARRFYLFLSVLLFVILATAGLAYVQGVASISHLDVALASRSWLLFAAGVCLGIYFSWLSPVLIGLDRVATNYRYIILSRGGFAVGGIIVLLLGGRLTALALTLLAADLFARLSLFPALAPVFANLSGNRSGAYRTRELFRTLLPNALRTGVVGLAAFLILRANAFVVTTFLGIGAMASFGITMQLVSGLHQVALLPMQVTLPKMFQAHVRRSKPDLRKLWLGVTAAYLATFVVGAATIVLAAQPVLDLIGSRVPLIPLPPLLLLCFIMLLEGVHTVAASLIQAGNQVPFVKSAILSGAGVIILGIAAANWGYGLIGIILAQGVVQASYNNWRWPTLVWKELRT